MGKDVNQQIIEHVRAIQELEGQRKRKVFPFMTEVYKEITFDSAHLLPNHQEDCKFLHGHTYKLGVTFIGQLNTNVGDSSEGMVIDFKEIKKYLKGEIDGTFDHSYINNNMFLIGEDGEQINFRTTAEQMAWYIFHWLTTLLKRDKRDNIQLVRVDLWETPTSKATARVEFYYPDVITQMLDGTYEDE